MAVYLSNISIPNTVAIYNVWSSPSNPLQKCLKTPLLALNYYDNVTATVHRKIILAALKRLKIIMLYMFFSLKLVNSPF